MNYLWRYSLRHNYVVCFLTKIKTLWRMEFIYTGLFKRKGKTKVGHFERGREKKFKWTRFWFLMVTEIELSGSGAHCHSLHFLWCLWGWIKSEVDEIKADTREETVRILGVTARIKKLGDQLGRTKRHLPTHTHESHWSWRWVFEHALYTVTNFSLYYHSQRIQTAVSR